MTTSRRSLRRRIAWVAPVATIGVIAAAVAVPMTASAGVPKLPTISPAALLAAVQTAKVATLSGQIVETARLGLPSLPGADSSASLDWQTLVTGSHTANLAIDGPDRQRLGVIGTLAESDVIHNGKDLWTYTSNTRVVTHRVLPARASDPAQARPDRADPTSSTPLGVANELLSAITPTTGVSLLDNTRVAGQKAYSLVLTPHQAGSTISRVVIAVDGTRYLPLRVQVFGQSKDAHAQPVFETGFTSIRYNRPNAGTFRFTVPKGATLRQAQTGADAKARPEDHASAIAKPAAEPKVLGTSWTSVVEIAAGPQALNALTGQGANGRRDGGQSQLLNHLVVLQPNGDRLLKTALLNVLVTKDGRVFAGAVIPSVLQQAAAAAS